MIMMFKEKIPMHEAIACSQWNVEAKKNKWQEVTLSKKVKTIKPKWTPRTGEGKLLNYSERENIEFLLGVPK